MVVYYNIVVCVSVFMCCVYINNVSGDYLNNLYLKLINICVHFSETLLILLYNQQINVIKGNQAKYNFLV